MLTPGSQTSLWRGAAGDSIWLLRRTGAGSPSWDLRIRGGSRVLVLAVTDEEGFLVLEAASRSRGGRAVMGLSPGSAAVRHEPHRSPSPAPAVALVLAVRTDVHGTWLRLVATHEGVVRWVMAHVLEDVVTRTSEGTLGPRGSGRGDPAQGPGTGAT